MSTLNKSAILGAAFLMATSAIGPGFLTQTTLFTQDLLASFGFVIFIATIIDIAAQMNIWRIVTVSEMHAQDIANKLQPGLGYILAALIAFGGMVFNIGNIAGAGLGLSILLPVSPEAGATISAILALIIFWLKEIGKVIDIIMKSLGLLMIGLTVYVAFTSTPPVGEAIYRTFWPSTIDTFKIVTIVGGTIGGYISFAGAHRLLAANIKGPAHLKSVSKSSITGILVTSIMRFVLFLAALGVVSQGITLSSYNPAATVFQTAAGNMGYYFFGLVLWIAAITSVIGASYTSVSFWKSLSPAINKHEKIAVSLFIVVSLLIFLLRGNPVQLLIAAGAVNGLILPLALAVMLLAVHKRTIVKHYKHPILLYIAGWAVVLIMGWMGCNLLVKNLTLFFE